MGNGKWEMGNYNGKKWSAFFWIPRNYAGFFSVTEACRRQLQSVSFTFKVRVFC